MNKWLSKMLSSLSRFLSNEFLALRMYQYWALGTVVFFGFFGIYPNVKAIFQKVPLVYEMSKINKDLSSKAIELSKLENVLKEVRNDATFLHNYMPDNFDIQNYMVDFVISAAQTGFLVDRFIPMEKDNNITEVSVTLSGGGNLPALVSLLEDMERVTEVSQLRYTVEKDGGILRVVVKTYSMQK